MQAALVGFLEGQGFSVDLYRRAHRDTGLRAFWATRGEMVAFGHVSVDGATSLHVRSGPCAPFVGGFEGSDRYERIDG